MVLIYTTQSCAFCHAAKDYLTKHHVEFEEIKVDKVEGGVQKLIDKSGQLGVPVIDIDGKLIVGFDREQLDAELREKRLID